MRECMSELLALFLTFSVQFCFCHFKVVCYKHVCLEKLHPFKYQCKYI